MTSYAEENDSDLSLEDLMNIEVTSVSKQEEKAFGITIQLIILV